MRSAGRTTSRAGGLAAVTKVLHDVKSVPPTVRPGWPARHSGDPGYGSGMYNQNVAVADMNGDGLKEVFAPMDGHYINAFNRGNARQLAEATRARASKSTGRSTWRSPTSTGSDFHFASTR